MIKLIPFQPEHLEQIELKEPYEQGECPKTIMHEAFTLIRGDQIIAIVGGFPFVPGVIHFWSFLSKHIHTYPVEFQKATLEVVDWFEKNVNPRRTQFEMRCTHAKGCRWAESLGFQKEGLMRAWGPNGDDFFLYGRLNKCHK